MDEDRVEDLKVAISEATTNSINAHRKADVSRSGPIAAASEEPTAPVQRHRRRPGILDGELPADSDPRMTPADGLFEGSLGSDPDPHAFPGRSDHQERDRGMTVTFILETEPVEAD